MDKKRIAEKIRKKNAIFYRINMHQILKNGFILWQIYIPF